MKIHVVFRETGGVAGIDIGCVLDTETMEEHEANELADLIRAADFFGFHALPHIEPVDALHYTLNVNEGDQHRELRLNEMQAWPEIRSLVAFLHDHSL
jgi:hypothetical protein